MTRAPSTRRSSARSVATTPDAQRAAGIRSEYRSPELFLHRKLRIKGDPMFALQVTGLLRIPRT